MPESSLLTAASGHRPGRPAGDAPVGLSDDDGTLSGLNTRYRPKVRYPEASPQPGSNAGAATAYEKAAGSHLIAGREVARLAVSLLARTVLFAILGLFVWAILPITMGWQPTTVVTGSMMPRIHAGDVIVVRPIPTGTAAPGQILLADDPDHAGRLRLHRYVEAAPDGSLILRGDANAANDSSPVPPEAVHGVAVLRVPFVGLPVVWVAEKNWGNLAAVFVATSALVLAAASGPSTPTSRSAFPGGPGSPRSTPRAPATRQPGTTRRPGTTQKGGTLRPGPRQRIRTRARPTARKTRTVQALLVLAAVPVLSSSVLSATAHAGFSAAAPTVASSFSALSSYPCPPPAAAPDGPTFFYRFNERSGLTAQDASGNQRHGTLNSETIREPGSCRTSPSPALNLGGSPGYVSAGNGAGAASVAAPDIFSVEIWFKTAPGSTAGGRLIGFGNAQTGDSPVSDRHLYMTSTGAIAFGVAPNAGNSTIYKASAITSAPGTTGDTFYNDGAWHQATATMSAAGMKLYVDGTLVSGSSVTSGARISGSWRVGYDAMNTNIWPGVTGSPAFTGTVDNAAVYPAALTAGQVAAHFNTTKAEIRGY